MTDYRQFGEQGTAGRAEKLIEHQTMRPDQATLQEYRGPSAVGMAISRGAVLGWLGSVTGSWVGDGLSKSHYLTDGRLNPAYDAMKSKLFAFVLGGVGTMMGVYSAMRDSNLHKQQVLDLQTMVGRQDRKIVALQDELKEQIIARKGEGDKAKLDRYDEDWQRVTSPEGKKPKPVVEAREISHEKTPENGSEIGAA